jgi:hypothetical protein
VPAITEQGVVLPQGHTGSSFFHHVLQQAVAAFPQALGSARLPSDARAFKREYREALVRFEAARVASLQRVEIARLIANRSQAELLYAGAGGTIPLSDHMAEPTSPVELREVTSGSGTPGLIPAVQLDGKRYVRREIIGMCERLVEQHQMTHAALDAVRFIIELIEERGGSLDLRGESFALLGAGAELAPTPLLLQAGARVLWVDLAEPSERLAPDHIRGPLFTADNARDLLRAPEQVAAALTEFADSAPIHVGMFAYAAGASREWRLGAAMNAVVRRLPPSLVRSLSFFVSPTMPASVQPEDSAAALEKLARAPGWQGIARGLGLLPTPGQLQHEGGAVARAIVSIQGLSYQAAQYVSKVAAAETYAVYGTRAVDDSVDPVTVSANVAGITNTRSLAHPLFQAAFIGAPRFGVRIFEPATTRALSGLMILSDLLNPRSASHPNTLMTNPSAKVRALLSQQVHGGIYSLPYELEAAIRVSAVVGMAQRPAVLWSSPKPQVVLADARPAE